MFNLYIMAADLILTWMENMENMLQTLAKQQINPLCIFSNCTCCYGYHGSQNIKSAVKESAAWTAFYIRKTAEHI